ncbi:MAG: glycoside hydrolase family 43 protein [Melioribacteraceae bacterium]|nr:glycoside hydrolase family 43 protein [Melioribacteraceae bacterium]
MFAGCGKEPEKEFFNNPILAGFYPDPSICKVGDNYYLVNSTFSYFPGIPVFHSGDLVNWKLIGHALDRPEQLSLNGLGVSRGIFAPAISYNNGTFYVTCTLVDGGGNFVVKADKPEGPWSDLIWLPEINGIDPSLFFDDDGRAYITFNSDAPDNKPLYEGHRTVRIVEFDITDMKVISEPKILINGGVDLSKKPIWIEGPHIYKINNMYYLTAAEGGTAEDHSQVILRSGNVDGPYIAYENNPILTQRHLDPGRQFPVTCTGHADFVQNDKGNWWAVFLGCRPYEPFGENFYNTGRETFLAPVKWITDNDSTGIGWPVINPDYEEVQYKYPLPIKPAGEEADIPYNGNFTLRDNFDSELLHPSWIFLRTPHEKWYELNGTDNYLSIDLRPETCSGEMNPSFIARRQQHSNGYAMTEFNFVPEAEHEKAGLLIFQDETHFYFICKSMKDNVQMIELYKSSNDHDNNLELIKADTLSDSYYNENMIFKIETRGRYYNFYYGINENGLKLLADNIDATYLSIRKAWGFTGNVFAMYATSLGNASYNNAVYSWFEYSGNDRVYHKNNMDTK